MSLEAFFNHFEQLADAPNGIQKLRELILQLAVRGKLVPQDPIDEPASVLLDKIKFEKEQWIKEGKVKKTKLFTLLQANEDLYKLPGKWEWGRFSDIVFFQEGPGIRNWQFRSNGIKLLNVKNIVQGQLVLENSDKYISEEEFEQKYSHFLIEEGDLIFASSGNSWGKTAFFSNPGYQVVVNTSTIRMRFFSAKCSANYLRFFLDSNVFKQQMEAQLQGIQPNFGPMHLNRVLIPLPPSEEQKRIVSKVDRLMQLCDELEERQRERRSHTKRLNEGAIAQLLTTTTPDDFTHHWQRIHNNFDLLYSLPENITQLRQAILQLAVQGKLASQDQSNETASDLLNKIASEKRRLAQEGKISYKPLPKITSTEKACSLPHSWQWARFGEILLSIEAGASPLCEKRPKQGDEWGVIKISAVSWDRFNPEENKALPAGLEPNFRYEIKKGDFLMSRANTRQLVGKSVVVETTPPRLLINDKTLRVSFPNFMEKRFFNLYNNSFAARDYYASAGTGTSDSMRNITREQIQRLPVPVPPLEEQKRIVAKVDRLMALCDRLEAELERSQSQSGKLMEAAVRQVLAN